MADPRRSITRRAILSDSHLKKLWPTAPNLLIKDYQGIIRDTAFISDEIDTLELRVIQNEDDILLLQEDVLELQDKVSALEYRVFDIIEANANLTTSGFQIIKCTNSSDIDITLNAEALEGDEVHIKRRGAGVNVIGLIDGLTNIYINAPLYSMHLVFTGNEWIEI